MPETPQATHSDYYNTRSICKTYLLTSCSTSSTRSRLYLLTHTTKTIVNTPHHTNLAPYVEE